MPNITAQSIKNSSDETTVTYLVSDQGNGGVVCDTCDFYESYGYWGNKCPNCHRHIVGDSTYIGSGGSDF